MEEKVKLGKYTVLVVDDEPEILKLISNYLELEGYPVITTTSPGEALKIIEEKNLRIVISDIMMPEMNGADFLRRVKQLDGLIQVVMITGYVSMNDILSSFRYGANNCLFKPFESLEQLKDEVNAAATKLKRILEVLRERNMKK